MNEFIGWTMDGCAHIDSLKNAAKWAERARANGVPVLLMSGGFDPIHPGHISYLRESVKKAIEFHSNAHGRTPTNLTIIVAVNSDEFLLQKKGVAFMPLMIRCQVVSAVMNNDVAYTTIVVPFTPTKIFTDMTVCEAIEVIKPTYFCKGGDRDLSNIPEVDVCKRVGTKIITNCGDEKIWSSSLFLDHYKDIILRHHKNEAK